MNNQYYILEDNEQSGPFSYDELTNMELDVHTRVLSPLADTWQDACDLPEFYPYFESRGIYLPTGDNIATFGWRLLAWIADYLIISFLTSFVVKALVSHGVIPLIQTYNDLVKAAPMHLLIMQLSFSVTLVVYNSICEVSPMQGSLGKKLCRLVVVDIDGQKLSYLNALSRSVGKAISVLLLYTGFLSIFFTEHRQALHDMLARTYVLKL
jgi:uncharacterized RDD family membrane protein YckC